MPNASLYKFGVLTSSMHMAWMRITSGRLKSDIRYSVKYTYNTFPWPPPPRQSGPVIQAERHCNPLTKKNNHPIVQVSIWAYAYFDMLSIVRRAYGQAL